MSDKEELSNIKESLKEFEKDVGGLVKTTKVGQEDMTVIWSGGFDSTALIIKYLLEGRQVWPVSVSLTNNENQAKAEKQARKNIDALLMEEFGRKLSATHEIVWPEVRSSCFEGCLQPPIWLYIAVLNSPTDDVALGWVRKDDVWHYREWIFKLQEAFDAFKGKTTTLHLPFEWMEKEDLLDYYAPRPHVFHALSTSQCGMPWSLGTDDKCVSLQALSLKLKERMIEKKDDVPYPSKAATFEKMKLPSPDDDEELLPEKVKVGQLEFAL